MDVHYLKMSTIIVLYIYLEWTLKMILVSKDSSQLPHHRKCQRPHTSKLETICTAAAAPPCMDVYTLTTEQTVCMTLPHTHHT